MKSTLQSLLAVIGIIAVSAASKQLAALQRLEQILARNRNSLLAFTIPVAALGFMLFMVQIMLMLYEKGKPMSHAEVEEQFRISQNIGAAPYAARWSKYRISGKAEGRQFSEQLPLRDFKLAWQSGAWRHDTTWRARYRMAGGAVLAIFGGLATAAVVGPIALSLVCAAFLIYAAVRLTWALWRA
jgi:hypothetical protein